MKRLCQRQQNGQGSQGREGGALKQARENNLKWRRLQSSRPEHECVCLAREIQRKYSGEKYNLTNTSIDLNVLPLSPFHSLPPFSPLPSLFPQLLFFCLSAFFFFIQRSTEGLYFLSISKYCKDGWRTA